MVNGRWKSVGLAAPSLNLQLFTIYHLPSGLTRELRSGARTGFDHRITFGTERAGLRLIRGHRQLQQRVERKTEGRAVVATIDDRARTDDSRACGGRDIDGFARREAGRDHVLYDQHAVGGRECESAPQRQLALLSLREHRADAESTPDLLPDDDSPESR